MGGDYRNVYVVGDVHGDFKYTLATLYAIGLIDSDGTWSGGKSFLIQMGDIFDRGDDGRLICDFFYDLRADAEEKGGTFLNLLGNHETMNFAGWLHYVSPGDYAQFGGKNARNKLMAKGGWYGDYLRGFRIIIAQNNTVFAHAGVIPEWAEVGVDDIQQQATVAIQREAWQAPVLSTSGPTWTREVVYAAEAGDCSLLYESLEKLSEVEQTTINRMVVGHTPQTTASVRFMCDGALVATDIAISRAMRGGKVGALLLYLDEEVGDVVGKAVPETKFTNFAVIDRLERKLTAQYKKMWVSGRQEQPRPKTEDEL